MTDMDAPLEADDEYCSECFDAGWKHDDFASAMGGCWWRYCDCEHGSRLSKEDDAKARKQKRLREEQSPYKSCPTCDGSGKIKKEGR